MKKIPVGRGRFTVVDDGDYPKLSEYCWYLNTRGYPTINVDLSQECGCEFPLNGLLMSRIILGLSPGDGFEADHVNHNLLDNRRENLRKVTKAQNQHNQQIRKGGTSKYKGVSWNRIDKRWQAGITVNGKTVPLGKFENESHAAHAYNLAARKHFGQYALLNKVG